MPFPTNDETQGKPIKEEVEKEPSPEPQPLPSETYLG